MLNTDGRWSMVVGNYSGMEALSADKIYDLISEYTDYLVEIQTSDSADSDFIAQRNVVIIGTPDSNKYIKDQLVSIKSGKSTIEVLDPESYDSSSEI